VKKGCFLTESFQGYFLCFKIYKHMEELTSKAVLIEFCKFPFEHIMGTRYGFFLLG
jgi:hypothetical protein